MEAKSMEGKISRNGAIEFWRFIFAVLIVIRHSRYIPTYFTNNYDWVKGQSIGVEFFFILSGFLMARSALNYQENTGTSTGKFILKKFLTILPTYLFAHFLSLIMLFIFQPDKFVGAFTGSFFEVFMLQITGLSQLNGYEYYIIEVAWYLSAMLLAMLVLFPLLHAKRKLFLNVICPCVTIYFMQDKCLNYGRLDTWGFWDCLTRAMAMICLGCIAYNICSHITAANENKEPTKLLKAILTVAEFGFFLVVVVMSFVVDRSKWDFVAVVLLAAAVTISFSGMSWSSKMFSAPIFGWLGKFSLSIYLNHVLWFKILREANMDLTMTQELVISLSLVIASSLLCMFFTDTMIILWRKNREKIKGLFVKEKQTT